MTKTTFYITPSGELVILESRTGKEIWRGMPEGVPVSKAIALPDISDMMVLLAYPHHPRRLFSNLIRMRPDGSIVWHAELPTGNDAYVDIEFRDGSLSAWSWSGYKALVDLDSGSIALKTFTK